MEKINSTTPGFPAPTIDALNKPFWDGAQRSELLIQKCCKCGDKHFPPSPVCPKCLESNQEWTPATGKATLFSWGVFHKAYWESVSASIPYLVAVVELEEGPKLMTNLVDIASQDELRLGMALRVTFREQSPGVTAPVFRPENE